MPKLEDIEQLKKIVDALGSEQSVRRDRGEQVEDVPPPEQTLPSDLEDLLGLAGGEDGAAPPPVDLDSIDTTPPPEDFQLDDISAALGENGEQVPASEETMGLDVLPEAFGEAPGDATAPAEADQTAPAEGGFDTSGLEGFDLPDFGAAAEPAGESQTDFAETAPDVTAEGEPAGASQTDFTEPTPDAAAKGEPAETGGAGLPEFDLSDFTISDTEPSLGEPVSETGDFGVGEEEPPVPPAAEVMFDQETEELPGAPDAVPETGAGTDEGGSAVDQFALPDIGELGGGLSEIEPESGAGPAGLEDQMFDLPEGEDAARPSSEPAEEFGSFEMPDLSEAGGGPGEAGGADIGEPAPTAASGGAAEDRMRPEEFDLPDFGAPAVEPVVAAGRIKTAGPAVPPPELAAVDEDVELSAGDFERLKETLATLPLNLKITVEELVGEKDLKGPRLKRLLDVLVAGESPRAVAAVVASITGRKIVLPKSFEKKTGVAFEREKDSFSHFLRTKGPKAVLVVAAAVLVLFILLVGGYQYVLKPLAVMPLYDQGYEAVVNGRFEEGREKFEYARMLWDPREQYYRFAEAFRDHVAGNYKYADDVYRELLERYPGDVKGTIDYARLKTLKMEYQEAERLLEGGLLLKDFRNFDGLAAAGENYLAWAEEDYARLKDADYYYQTLLENHGERTAARLKRLEYFVRAERLARRRGDASVDHLARVQAGVLDLRRRKYDVVDPGLYTLLAEYLIDRNEIDPVPELLGRAQASAPGYAPAAYERARYYQASGEPEKEFPALERAIELLAETGPDRGRNFLVAHERLASAERTAKLVLARTRLAELQAAQGKPELAEGLLLDAQALYEARAFELSGTRFAAGGAFGRIYYNLGTIALGNDQLERALEYFRGAEKIGFASADQSYKKGFIQYRRADFDAALLEFHRVNGEEPENENALFALATTQYRRRQFQSAEGYYLYAVRLMRSRLESIPDLRPGDNPRHLSLVTNLYVTYNNLGCAYFKQSRFDGDRALTEAVDYLQRAAEMYDVISRYPDSLRRYEETMVVKRRGDERLATDQRVAPPFYNQDVIFHNKAGTTYLNEMIDVVIYQPAYADLGSEQLVGGDRRARR